MKLFAIKRTYVKFQFDITIHHLMKLQKNGVVLYISWRRGKKWHGETQKSFVKDKTAVWEQDISMRGTLFKNSQQKFKKKFFELYFHEVVKEGNSKKGKIGELKLNLADFASQQNTEQANTRTLPVKLWNSSEAQFKITIKSKVIPKSTNGLGVDEHTDATTMTDASDDGADDDDDDSSHNTNSLKSPTKPATPTTTTTTSNDPDKKRDSLKQASNLTLQDRRKNQIARRFMEIKPDNGLSDDEDQQPTDSPAIVINKDPAEVEATAPATTPQKRGDRMKQLMASSKQRREVNMSLSMEDDQDAFLEAINANNQKSPRDQGDNSDGSDNESNAKKKNTKELDDAKAKLSKQEQELKLLHQKIKEQERAETERLLLDTLITSPDKTFSNSISVSAALLFKALRYWDCFDPNKKLLLQKVIGSFELYCKKHEANNENLAYALTTVFTLLNLVHKEHPASIDEDANATLTPLGIAYYKLDIPESEYSLVSQTPVKLALEEVQSKSLQSHDDFGFESPASIFKNDLKAVGMKIYSHLLKNIYQELLTPLTPALFAQMGTSKITVSALLSIFSSYLKVMKKYNVFPELITMFFVQVYYFINAQAMTALLAPKSKFCTMGSAITLKMSITQLENWASDNKPCDNAKEQLSILRQSTNVLIMNKSSLIDDGTRREVCGDLSIADIKQLLNSYKPDDFDPEEISQAVLKALPGNDSKTSVKPDAKVIYKPKFTSDSEIPGWEEVKPPIEFQGRQDLSFLLE